MPKLCPNIRFPHQQDFFPIRSVTKSSTSRFSHENLVEKFKIFVQDFVPIRTALNGWGKCYFEQKLSLLSRSAVFNLFLEETLFQEISQPVLEKTLFQGFFYVISARS